MLTLHIILYVTRTLKYAETAFLRLCNKDIDTYVDIMKTHLLGYLIFIQRGASNEYPQHMFSWRYKIISILLDCKKKYLCSTNTHHIAFQG